MKEAAKFQDSPLLEYVEIPYENGKSLPGIFMKASADRKTRRPAVVFFDGLDVTKEMCGFFGVPDLVRRGINCLLVDGPGNGESIRFRDLIVRYDQEVPSGAAVDYLETRSDVDPEKIGVMALSLGGYYAPRAASIEKRFKACVAWGAQWDYQQVWKRRLEIAFKTDLSVPPDHICWFTGTHTIEEALEFLEKFKLEGVVEQMECPFLLVHGLNDTQIPMEDAQACFDAVGSKDKTFKVFAEGEGGLVHCNWDYLTPVVQYMYDWLAEKLKP
jgi:dipeptidyl aminopeptidase/acylaminoacyl peptidase